MELAIHNWMRSEPIEATIRRIAKLGYKKLEIAGNPYDYDTKAIKKLLDEHGLSCWGSVSVIMGDRNLLAKDEDQRASWIQIVKDVLKVVGERKGLWVSFFPGT